jgi:hypothetical protein
LLLAVGKSSRGRFINAVHDFRLTLARTRQTDYETLRHTQFSFTREGLRLLFVLVDPAAGARCKPRIIWYQGQNPGTLVLNRTELFGMEKLL